MRHAAGSRQIHELLRGVPTYRSGFCASDLPKNGIYFFYEKGELFEGAGRIVRVGTHTGDGRLPKRLMLHFDGTARRSVFRRNVGRALVAAGRSQFPPDALALIDSKKFPIELEGEITRYFEEMFSFSVIQVDEKEDRLRLEAGLIATLAVDSATGRSDGWLGRFSPVVAIRSSGLWNRNHVGGMPLSNADFALLRSAR